MPRRLRRRRLGRCAGSPGRRALPSTSTRCCARAHRQDGARPAARRPRRLRHRALRRPRAGARRRARRPGPPLGLQARQPLGLGALQRLRGLDGAPRRGDFLDGVSVFVPALRARARPEHAGRRPLRSARTSAATTRSGRTRNPSRFGLTLVALRGRRRQPPHRRSRSTRRASRSSASPTPTPTASWPIATTARWPRCASSSSTARPGRRGWLLRDTLVAAAAPTSSTPSASPCATSSSWSTGERRAAHRPARAGDRRRRVRRRESRHRAWPPATPAGRSPRWTTCAAAAPS